MKINLTDTVSYYSYTWDTKDIEEIIETSYEISRYVNSHHDGHGIWEGVKSEQFIRDKDIGNVGDMVLEGIGRCKELYKKEYELIESSAWVNIINSSTPRQKIRNFDGSLVYHTHTDKSREQGEPIPDYTFIFYIQMPNNLKGDDGKLFMKDKQGNESSILPYEGQLVILYGDVPHSPVDALNSTKDRIVLAGNVCFRAPQKKKYTLL